MCKFIFITLAVLGCYKPDPGPHGDVSESGTGGYWKMSEYYVRGKQTPIERLPERLLMQVETRLVEDDDALGASMYTLGSSYFFYSFFDQSVARTDSFQSMYWRSDCYPKYQRDMQWHRIKDNFGILVMVEREPKTGLAYRVQLSNVIKSDHYDPGLDTMRMTYLPTEKFN